MHVCPFSVKFPQWRQARQLWYRPWSPNTRYRYCNCNCNCLTLSCFAQKMNQHWSNSDQTQQIKSKFVQNLCGYKQSNAESTTKWTACMFTPIWILNMSTFLKWMFKGSERSIFSLSLCKLQDKTRQKWWTWKNPDQTVTAVTISRKSTVFALFLIPPVSKLM